MKDGCKNLGGGFGVLWLREREVCDGGEEIVELGGKGV